MLRVIVIGFYLSLICACAVHSHQRVGASKTEAQPESTSQKKGVVILKLDDLYFAPKQETGVDQGWVAVARFLDSLNIKAGFGIIA